MSEGPGAGGREGGAGRKPGSLLKWALSGAALLGVAAVLYIIGQASTKQAPVAASPPPARTSALASKLVVPDKPTPAPDYAFHDEAGKALKVADFKGKVVVLNVWATWCAPCVTEMPTLAKLQAAYAGQPVEVVAVSIDSSSAATKARLFLARQAPLKFYHDPTMKLPFKLNAQGAPTTVIYGKDGLETARVAGEADWSSPEARALVDKALAAS